MIGLWLMIFGLVRAAEPSEPGTPAAGSVDPGAVSGGHDGAPGNTELSSRNAATSTVEVGPAHSADPGRPFPLTGRAVPAEITLSAGALGASALGVAAGRAAVPLPGDTGSGAADTAPTGVPTAASGSPSAPGPSNAGSHGAPRDGASEAAPTGTAAASLGEPASPAPARAVPGGLPAAPPPNVLPMNIARAAPFTAAEDPWFAAEQEALLLAEPVAPTVDAPPTETARDAARPLPSWATGPVDEEIVARARRSAEGARRDVSTAVEGLGYRPGIDLGDVTVHVGEELYKPIVIIHDDGRYRMQGVRGIPIPMPTSCESASASLAAATGEATFPGVFSPANASPNAGAGSTCATMMTQTKGQIRTQKRRIAAAMHEPMSAWVDAMSAENQLVRHEEVLTQLYALWDRGEAADGRTIPEPAARRAEIVAMWRNTADSVWGDALRMRIETFIDDVVQGSPHPFTPAEVAAIEANNPFPRPFYPRSPLPVPAGD